MEEALVVALAFIILFVLMLAAVYDVMLIAPRRPTPQKLMRYEAGNPEAGPPKAPLAMQYLGYVLMLVTLEPVAALPLAVFLFTNNVELTIAVALLSAVVILAASIYAYKYAKRIDMWRV